MLRTHVNPRSAFTPIDTIGTGNGFYTKLYALDQSLRGHEILVASSNNNAVENITRELPLKTGVTDELPELQFFKTLSDAVAKEKHSTWGLIAAPLGNGKNRRAFAEALWWDDDLSLQTYFKAIRGKSSKKEQSDPRCSTIALQEAAPANLAEALQQWQATNSQFKQVLMKAESVILRVQIATEKEQELEKAQTQLSLQTKAISQHQQALSAAEAVQCAAELCHQNAQELVVRIRDQIATLELLKPTWVQRLFQRDKWRSWITQRNELLHTLLESQKSSEIQLQAFTLAQTESKEAKKALEKIQNKLRTLQQQVLGLNDIIHAAKDYCTDHLQREQFWTQSHEKRQTTAPNFTDIVHGLRDDVFVAAIKLHKAFIDACAEELNQNLRLYFREIGSNPLPENKRHLAPQLWSTLSLITPVVSTTFASVGKMLGDLPPDTFGWLLIDEAGQATPQAAVGAIARAKRVIAVGDPLQVSPVTSLPKSLIESMASHMGVNSDIWMPDQASVQTLADNANAYGTVMDREDGYIRVGAPLLVHRRCDDPMFSMSNNIAYGGLMVQGKVSKPSQLLQFFGPSRWYDIRGTASDKWCEQEGDHVFKMLTHALQALPELPDIYIISPFRVVAQTMSRRLQSKTMLLRSLGIEDVDQWIQERVGTVHTFQGKEAEAVILLLGASGEEQTGARYWASSQVNILNVAVSRAKACFYVVGNKELWGQAGYMKVITQRLPKSKVKDVVLN